MVTAPHSTHYRIHLVEHLIHGRNTSSIDPLPSPQISLSFTLHFPSYHLHLQHSFLTPSQNTPHVPFPSVSNLSTAYFNN